MAEHKIASELSQKAYSDTTKYKAMEVAHAFTEGLMEQLMTCVQNHKSYMDDWDQDEFCVVYVVAGDPLIKNLRRRKFYCWPYLPSPRPNQTVFLYNKRSERIIKRLWTLPVDQSMAELSTPGLIVDKPYKDMQRWSVSFFRGTFWSDIRKEHDIKMLSQEEWDALNRNKIVELGLEDADADRSQPFDFSKIQVGQLEDAGEGILSQNG